MSWILPHAQPHSISSAQCLSLSLLDIHVFISSPSVYITYTSLSYRDLRRAWHRLNPPPPPPNTEQPSHKGHIPPSSCRKDTHLPRSQIPAMFCESGVPSFMVPPSRRPPPPSPHKAKNATNYWGSDAEGFLLTPDRSWWGSEMTLPDTLGDGGGAYCLEPALLHHVLLLSDIRPLPLWQRGNALYVTVICV